MLKKSYLLLPLTPISLDPIVLIFLKTKYLFQTKALIFTFYVLQSNKQQFFPISWTYSNKFECMMVNFFFLISYIKSEIPQH